MITTDKGLCGGLNTNLLRLVLNQHKEWLAKGIEAEYCTIGNKGFGFVNRMGGKIVSQVTNYGDHPALERLIGPVKMLIDGFLEGSLDEAKKQFTFNGSCLDPQGKPMTIKQLYSLPDADTRSLHMTSNCAEGAHEMKIAYTRVKG